MNFNFIIPLPPQGCSPNIASSRHWTKRSEGTKLHRLESKYLCLKAKPKGWKPQKIKIKCYFYHGPSKKGEGKRYRARDIQNAIASLKGAIDGIIDAGIAPDDTYKWLKWGEVDIYGSGEHQNRSEVEIFIEAMTVE